MLPFLEVEHLPSSSSFYSAVLQPLGLRYLDTEDGHFPSITFGTSSRNPPVFQIRQVVASRDRPLRTSHIVLSAPSPAAAEDAYEFALRANPDSRHSASGASAHRTPTGRGGSRVLITDFDGNSMEIAYQPPPNYPSHYTGSTVRYTRSTNEEAGRILDWNYDVASSSAPSPVGPGSASGASRRSYGRHPEDDDEPHPGIRRSVTAGISTYEPATSARENSNGLSAGAVVGTLLGVAAAGAALGGAFTYNMVKSDSKSRGARAEYDMPSLGRRSTFADRYDGYEDRKPRYVDVERAVEKVRYQSDYPPPSDYRRPPPEYIARYAQIESPRSSPRSSRDVVDDRYNDARGRHPSSRSRASSVRPRSESASHREPYAVVETEHRSHVSSRSSRHHPPIVQRSYTYDTPDRESYVSARSHRSNSTVRAPPPQVIPDPYDAPPPVRMSSSRSRSGSRVTTTRTITVGGADGGGSPQGYTSREGSYISARNVPLPDSRAPTYISARDIPMPDSSRAPTYISARHVPLPASRAPTYISARDIPLPASRPSTYVSARHVPLPGSHVGNSHARWAEEEGDGGDDDDADSIAPSDSISCVGSRRSGRSHHY